MKVIGIHGSIGSGKDTVADYLTTKYRAHKVALADPLKRLCLHVFDFPKKGLWGPSSRREEHDSRYQICNIKSACAKLEWGKPAHIADHCDEAWVKAANRLFTYGPIWVKDILPRENVDEVMPSLCEWFTNLGHEYPKLTPRVVLQTLGTEWGRRVIDEDLWVNVFDRTSRAVLKGQLYQSDFGILSVKNSEPTCIACPDVRMPNEIQHIKNQNKEGYLIRLERPDVQESAHKKGVANHSSEMRQVDIDYSIYDVILNNNSTLDSLYKSLDTIMACYGVV